LITILKKVSPEDIDNFAKSYRNSKEEEQDLKKAYVEYKGDVEKIMDAVPLCTDDDLDRFVNTLKQHIQTGTIQLYSFNHNICSGELKEYSKFEKSITDFRASLEKRKKAQDKEALEAEEILKKAKEQEDLNALALSIRGNKTKQQAKLEELVANLESKYVTKGGNKNRRGKSSKSAKYEEPSEEEFQKARERLEKRMSNNKSAPVNKNKKVKRTK
jgi:DnaJ family protein C protein 9